jgi:hypothetical protein
VVFPNAETTTIRFSEYALTIFNRFFTPFESFTDAPPNLKTSISIHQFLKPKLTNLAFLIFITVTEKDKVLIMVIFSIFYAYS